MGEMDNLRVLHDLSSSFLWDYIFCDISGTIVYHFTIYDNVTLSYILPEIRFSIFINIPIMLLWTVSLLKMILNDSLLVLFFYKRKKEILLNYKEKSKSMQDPLESLSLKEMGILRGSCGLA